MTGGIPESLDSVGTLVDLVLFRRARDGRRVFLNLLDQEVTFEGLARGMDACADALRQRGVAQGDRVVVILPTCVEFFFAFFGTQRTGAIPVPLYPNAPPQRIVKILRDCAPRAIVTARRMFGAAVDQLAAQSPQTVLVDIAEIQAPDDSAPEGFPAVGPEDLAFLQYTSGSTAEPKGVQLSHRNLLVNIRAIIERMHHNPEETGVSWLPLYHDMGLIGFVFCPLYSASKIVILPPDLRDPGAWLRAITRHRAHFTGAPDFAYRLCNLMPDTSGIDLSSLRVAYCGGEPVRASTVRAFQERFRLGNVLVPSYGLAETSLCVSTCYPGTTVAEDDSGFVSVGRPVAGTTVRIVQDGDTLPPYQVGEICLRAESNTSGYWKRPEENGSLFTADGMLRTGDMGYLDPEGNLYVVGRQKNLIIRGGENIAPQELEEAADGVSDIRFSAAIGCAIEQFGGSEQVLVFAEVRDPALPQADLARIVNRIRSAIHERMGFFPNQVYLVKPRTIPRTANGKIQHVALREAFLGGRLAGQGGILHPLSAPQPGGGITAAPPEGRGGG